MKKLISTVLAAALTLSLAACGSTAASSTSETAHKTLSRVTITHSTMNKAFNLHIWTIFMKLCNLS